MEAVRVSGVCVAMLSHNSFICKYNIFSEPTNYQRQFYKTGRQKRELFVSFANCTVFFFYTFPVGVSLSEGLQENKPICLFDRRRIGWRLSAACRPGFGRYTHSSWEERTPNPYIRS